MHSPQNAKKRKEAADRPNQRRKIADSEMAVRQNAQTGMEFQKKQTAV